MRWTRNEGWDWRKRRLHEVFRRESPDVVSIQFVPYSFSPKGLPFEFIRWCSRLMGTRERSRWHVMFHELWVGQRKGKRLSSWAIANLQRLMIRQLRFCDVSHTHLPQYKASLDRIGFNAQPLSLFSNIPCTAPRPDRTADDVLNLGFFSRQEPHEIVRDWLDGFISDARENGMKVCVHFAGGFPEVSERYWRAALEKKAHVMVHGWMTPDETSAYLRSLDAGVTTVPSHAIGKSGSVAAFLEHGVPVALPFRPQAQIGFFSESEKRMVIENFQDLQDPKRCRGGMPSRLESIGEMFLSSLGACGERVGDTCQN